ncbi:hypothetical protein M408DRAFT_29225 [Serendipita vermifera MAFF 305830]|uniref:Helicase C-terminal domain-containing protein n=1 Tax=Serendipita vermifera MAFF 305830 TaxID=933852 RepID=A0A0C3AP44_SERVB|nr:hypothetical protein M408DRAFT_29225 [Serendipita vermifera MAFF 305830]
MPPKASSANQTSLANWFKSPKGGNASADKEDAVNTDDEGRTLPPPSEPDTDMDDAAPSSSKPKKSSKKSVEIDDEMEEDDDGASHEPPAKRKLILAKETSIKSSKPRKSNATAKEKPAKRSKKKPAPKAKAKAKKSKKTSEEESEEEEEEEEESSEAEGDNLNKAKAHADDLKLPPLTTMPAIFKDIVARNPKLKDVADIFHDHPDETGAPRKLRVGTMCSGTESPLLALQLISEAMEVDQVMEGRKLDIEHIFSCEIEPFKQAYIERNFQPPILFRDVTELGGEEATTAYGALVPVPGNIDILIAGTSCVDYSTLNSHQKAITDGGESGNTFFGMLSYVINHRPPVVVLENVCSAPWDHVCDEFEAIGYKARQVRLDTKGFYIPHTRMRGYLIAIEAKRWKPSGVNVNDIVDAWVTGMKTYMQRPASCTLDAFLLPSDDPRIHEGRQRLAMETKMSAGRRRKEVDWARCEQRHTRCRAEEAIGNKRPLTKWDEGGGFTFLDHIWEDWCADSVPRVKDLMDISHLRAAKVGVDSSYKTTVWNLSQNVDRQIGSGRLGIAPCLTPTMIAYITNRGGPLVGLEALGLQGLPVDRLLLTRETQDQLADLAGNAMSTTVVGSSMILALMLSVPILEKALEARDEQNEDESMRVEAETIVERSQYTDTLDDRIAGLDQLAIHPLEISGTSELSWPELLQKSTDARRWCRCEGRLSVSDRQMQECQDCGTTACVKCGLRPEHNYQKVVFSTPRPQPVSFAEEAKKALPMAVTFSNVPSADDFDAMASTTSGQRDSALWRSWKGATILAISGQLSFVDLRRQEIWVVIYESANARLELHMHPKQAEWRLFAIPDPSLNANSPVRGMLNSPVARMRCEDAALSGTWEFAVPVHSRVNLVIQGVGEGEDALTDSWQKSLGLLDAKFRDKMVWKQLSISIEDGSRPEDNFDRDVAGTYVYLPRCGTASNSLHKRVRDAEGNPVDDSQPDLYFFLDPTRCREGSWDRFVFSSSTRRYEFEECRPIVAKIAPTWRQTDRREQRVEASADWKWISAASVVCKPAASTQATYGRPKGPLELIIDEETCARAIALLTCSVHLGNSPSDLWPKDRWFEVDKLREREYVRLMAWVLQRVRDISHDAVWKDVTLSSDLQDSGCQCERCAPTPPDIKWYKKEKGRGSDVQAIEDPKQAGPFERALKARPAPFQIHLKYSSNDHMGHIVIGINPATLIHQAASHLPRRSGPIKASWRLDTAYVPTPAIPNTELVIPSNRHDPPAAQPEGFKLPLRPEQLRSLHWMQQQEDTAEAFIEEEICEGASENLGWRLEGRARRPVLIRGGVLADQVGYGKTAIMLGLIATRNAKQVAKRKDCPPGKILAKGTCVIVPAHLVLQWKGEVTKFVQRIGKHTPKVITLHQGTDINATTIEDIQEADVIIVASSMPNSEHYWDNLGSFAGVSLPNKAGRYFNARLKQAHEALGKQVELLQQEGGVKEVHKVIKEAYENIETQEQFVQRKRLKGKAYAEANQEKSKVLKELPSTRGEDSEVVALPIKRKQSNKAKAAPKETRPREVLSPSSINSGPTRQFLGVVPPKVEGANAKEWLKSSAAQASLAQKGRRKSVARKVISLVDSDDSESSDIESSKKSDESFQHASEESHSESDDDEVEPSSEDDVVVISDDESDIVVKKKYKPQPKTAKRPAKAVKEAKRGQKRKNMASDAENEGEEQNEGPPAKKAKIVKPKKSRATTDPWKLGDSEVQKDWTQMKAPPLDMFHFHRVVVDEFTYTKKEHVSHAIVTQLSATCRWVMSGTPPTGDFASVKGIATFLGIHLGVDDDAEGTTEEVKSRIQDKTAAEAFHSFRDVRTAYWHAARHTTAQSFIDRFVRQNLAEIDDIPLIERICAVTLTASERALYLELDHYLRAQDLKMKKTGKSQSDRVRRLNKALGDSKTPEEALLKCASHFDCQTDDALNSTVACDVIVQQREAERDKCMRELRRKLIRAFKTERKLRGSRTKDGPSKSHFKQALDEWEHGGDKDSETKELLAQLVAEAKDPDAVIEPETSNEEDEPILNAKAKKGASKSKASAKKTASKKTVDEDDMDDADLEWAHREHAHELRALAKELGGRVRSLRFFQCVRAFQGNPGLLTTCPNCQRTNLLPTEVSILSSCGHVGCHACVAAAAASEACVQQATGGCRVPANPLFVVPADSLGQDKQADADGRHWGQKLEDIVDLIQSYPRDERVLLFVQFPDLTKKVAEALEAHSLTFSEIRGTAMQQSKVLQDFQNPDSKARILLLNLGDESASGGNLTVANHAIFISPLLSKNQFEYTQAETQAIGRIRRFGQVKTANIYRFVTRNTIDEEIYRTRGQALGDLSQKVQTSRVIGLHEAPKSPIINAMDIDTD